tara:strand:+ start:1013 stop:1219 length:207 start_codon:yes stop_codon:yes gene_type:complete
MTVKLKENNFLEKASKDSLDLKKMSIPRPNIDHLIKRILVERRKEKKKHFIIFAVIFLIIAGLALASF